MSARESYRVKKIVEWLNGLWPDAKAIKLHGNLYMERGTPDVMACVKGRLLMLEVKVGGGKATKIQKLRLKQWCEAGALAEVVSSVQDVKELIQSEGLL